MSLTPSHEVAQHTRNISEADARAMAKELYETYANFKADAGDAMLAWENLPESEVNAWCCIGFVSLGFAQLTVDKAIGLIKKN